MLSKVFKVTVTLLALMVGVIATSPVAANGFDDGCSAIASNAGGINRHSSNHAQFSGTYNWQQGQTISWNLSAGPNQGNYVKVQVEISSQGFSTIQEISTQAGGSVSSSGSYTFKEDGTYHVSLLAMHSNKSNGFSARVSCGGGRGATVTNAAGEVSNIVMPPDDRVNWQGGDLFAVAYSRDYYGQNPELHVYCWVPADQTSYLAFAIMPDTVAGLEATGDNQLIAGHNQGSCRTEFWLLADGTYQLNIYGDNGKIYEMLDTDLNFRDAEQRYYDPNE